MPVGLGVAAGVWVVLDSALGFVLLDSGAACSGNFDDEYRPRGAGAEAA